MERKFQEGERIVIKLNNGENYEGDYVKRTDKGIEIENIHHYETETKVNSRYWFYRREIDTIYKLNDKQNEALSNCNLDERKQTKSDNDNSILLAREEYDRLKEVATNFTYLKTDDKSYYDAVNEIANFESVGVFAIGSEKGRCGRITLIALSTWKQAYIFDIKNFRSRKFPAEIAEIFESHYIKKVTHNGGTLMDCLQYAHQINMNNIFDTQVSHLLITKISTGNCPKTIKSIGECLTEYFNFPSTLLASSLEALNDSWENRPLEEDKLKKLSRLVTYLITMKDYQISLMLKDYEKTVEDYHNLFTKSSEFQMIKLSTTKECTRDIENIIPAEFLKSESIKSVKSE